VAPHSQSNLYTNASFDQGFSQVPIHPSGTLKIVGVVTPADVAQGDELYRTSSTDVLINTIRLALSGTLPANTNWGTSSLLLSPTYCGGHSFMGCLTAGPSRTHILNDTESSLIALASVNPC
jgi:hypothetical protein